MGPDGPLRRDGVLVLEGQGGHGLLGVVLPGQDPQEEHAAWLLPAALEAAPANAAVAGPDGRDNEESEEVQLAVREQGSCALVPCFKGNFRISFFPRQRLLTETGWFQRCILV